MYHISTCLICNYDSKAISIHVQTLSILINEACPKVALNLSTDAPLEGKTVLLVGGEGALGVALQCLIERSGMVALKSHWHSKNLQKQVFVYDSFFIFLMFFIYPKYIFINVRF